eukprot:1150913-Pelagomonas_calceolata.AAC.1
MEEAGVPCPGEELLGGLRCSSGGYEGGGRGGGRFEGGGRGGGRFEGGGRGGGRFEGGGRGGGRFDGGGRGGGGGGRGGPADYHDVSPQQGMQQMMRALSNMTISGPKQVGTRAVACCQDRQAACVRSHRQGGPYFAPKFWMSISLLEAS